MQSTFVGLGAICAFLGVGLGAFGAHALKAVLTAEMLAVYQTGISYQMWHSVGLLLIGLLHRQHPGSKLILWAGWLMFIGILLFSGSLYLLVMLASPKFGMITPIGGVCFLLAWFLVCLSAYNNKPNKRYL